MEPSLRDWRERANITQTALARAVNRNKSHISNIEAGRSGMSPVLAANIAKKLSENIPDASYGEVLAGISPAPTLDASPLPAAAAEHCSDAA